MHHVLQAAALHMQVHLAASHPLRTSAAGGDGAVVSGVAAAWGKMLRLQHPLPLLQLP